MSKDPLRDRVAVVTGASSGIGAAVARALAREGARVALAARRYDALLGVQAVLEEGVRSLIFPADVTDRQQVGSLVSRAEEELGPVDVLVNCAGVMYYTLMRNLREEEWERTVEVNCKGALNCVGAVLPGMLKRGRGHIITVSSDAGRKVFPGLAAGDSGNRTQGDDHPAGQRRHGPPRPERRRAGAGTLRATQWGAGVGSRRRCRPDRPRALPTRARVRKRDPRGAP